MTDKGRRKKPVTLPRKPSALLRLAVTDCKKVAKLKGYKLDMGVWHQPNGVCHVCMAGGILAVTLKVPRKTEVDLGLSEPAGLDSESCDALRAVNDLRAGRLRDACRELGTGAPEHGTVEKFYERVNSDWDGELGRASWATYLSAADELEKAGL